MLTPKSNIPDPQRRQLILGSGALLLAPWIQTPAQTARRWQGADPFCLGVAAGDPAPDGFVLWTRLAPEPLSGDRQSPGGMRGPSLTIGYEIASDEQMRSIVRSGTVAAEALYAWSVHLEVTGLQAGRPYWYRFMSGDATSRIGRATTLPAPASPVQQLRLGYVSCANYEHGYFSAYRHLASEQVDAVLFLGDYLYEYIDRRNPVVRRHSDGVAATTLPTYRNRHAQYKLDADLQALHASTTALITWDDHEVQNNYAGGWSQDFSDPRKFMLRRAAAYQAFYEHMPVRPSRGLPDGPVLRVYDRYRFGELAEVSMIDGRQYRSAPACQTPETVRNFRFETNITCPERLLPERSMLGAVQEKWLFDGLTSSKTRWNILAQDVQVAQNRKLLPDGASGFRSDSWDGYPAARKRLLQHLHDSKVNNPLVLTGDIHAWCTADLKLDFDEPRSPTVAREFVVSSISANGPARNPGRAFYADNPHMLYYEGLRRGYATVDLSGRSATVRYRAVSDVSDPAATIETLKSFQVDGKAGPG